MAEHQSGSQQGHNRGFGSMDEKKQREAASKGGQSVPAQERSFPKDHELAGEAGRKGGKSHDSSHSSSHGSSSSSERSDEQRGSQRGGGGNFSQDHERASEAGRKGGQH